MERNFLIFALFLLFSVPLSAFGDPPLHTTIDIGDVVRNDDPGVDFGVLYKGVFELTTWDNRVAGGVATHDMHVFTVTYADEHSTQYEVNTEFGNEATAHEEVVFYASSIGQLPFVIRTGIQFVALQRGEAPHAGGGHSVLIHTDNVTYYFQNGTFYNLLMHEAGHAALEPLYLNSSDWVAAQQADGAFISQYAQDLPHREDMTESFTAYLALFRCDRVGEAMCTTIRSTIPHRIAFFDRLNLNLEPVADFPFQINAGLSGAWFEPATAGQGFFLEVLPESGQIFLGWYTFDMERPAIASGVMGDSGQRWMTALGPYEGDTATLTVYQTEGGVFDAENPEPFTDPKGDGTITLEFSSCTEGLVHYEIDSTGASGSIPIERIANDNAELCEAMVARDGQVPK